MENKYTALNFSAKIKPVKPVNSEFTLVKVYIQGVGKNRNFTYMSRERIEQFLPTLDYCPVVGHIREWVDENGNIHHYMGSHDGEIDWDRWEWKDLTVPYGVVVPDSYEFETVNEYGSDVEYLVGNAILWTGRYPELNECIYSDDIWFNQSMEIKISQYRPLEEDSSFTELLEWEYSALCLLGKADKNSTNGHTDDNEHSEPCFISAKIVPVEFAKSEFASALSELKEKISFCLNHSSTEEVDSINNEGGTSMTDEDQKIVDPEVTDPVPEVEKTTEEESGNTEVTTDSEGECVEPNSDPEGEDPVDEGDGSDDSADGGVPDYTAMYAELAEKYAALNNEYDSYKKSHSFLNSEYEELKTFKENAEIEKRNAEESAVFAEYEDELGDKPEFRQLKENAKDFSIETLKKECLCIVGAYARANRTDKPAKKEIKFSVEPIKNETDEPYGGVMKRYLGR